MTPDILILDQDNKKELIIIKIRITDATSKRIAKVLRDDASAEYDIKGHGSYEGREMLNIAHLLDPQ